MKRALIATAVVALLSVIVIASLRNKRSAKGTEVYLEGAEVRSISQRVKASGQIDPRVKVNISAHVIGKIERLYVEEGDEIAAGSPFLDLEKEAFLAVRDRAAAQLEINRSAARQAEIDLDDASLKLRRAERLRAEEIASVEQFEAAELAYRSAQVRIDQAKEAVRQASADLEKARDDLEKTTIYAPLSGRVISLQAEEGEVVVSGTMNNAASVIGVIADLSEILVEIDVDETDIVYLDLGQAATISVDALPDEKLPGSVVEIGSSGFNRPQQPDVTFFKVKVLLDQPDVRLRPGMSARAEIDVTTHDAALVIPIQSVVARPPLVDGKVADEGEEIDVVFVQEDGKAIQRAVETGISDPTHVEVLSGVEVGEKVVTGPYRTLKKLGHEDSIREKKRSKNDEKDDGEDDEDVDREENDDSSEEEES